MHHQGPDAVGVFITQVYGSPLALQLGLKLLQGSLRIVLVLYTLSLPAEAANTVFTLIGTAVMVVKPSCL